MMRFLNYLFVLIDITLLFVIDENGIKEEEKVKKIWVITELLKENRSLILE